MNYSDLIKIRESPIHGKGVFAAKDISSGTVLYDNVDDYEVIDPFSDPEWDNHSSCMRADGRVLIHRLGPGASWTEYLNHSDGPNIVMVGDDMDIVAVKDIQEDEEITVDYRAILHRDDKDRIAVFGQVTDL